MRAAVEEFAAASPIASRHSHPRYKVLARTLSMRETVVMKVIIRNASVRWIAGAKGGSVTLTTQSGGRRPAPIARRSSCDKKSAELIAAAHAGSFSLALVQELGRKALLGGHIVASSAVTLEHVDSGWTIMNIHLNVVAKLPKVTQGRFIDATVRAKTNCLVSRVLRATISMDAKLEN